MRLIHLDSGESLVHHSSGFLGRGISSSSRVLGENVKGRKKWPRKKKTASFKLKLSLGLRLRKHRAGQSANLNFFKVCKSEFVSLHLRRKTTNFKENLIPTTPKKKGDDLTSAFKINHSFPTIIAPQKKKKKKKKKKPN
jgi:hypothetical protein